jgi:hypothetical protein
MKVMAPDPPPPPLPPLVLALHALAKEARAAVPNEYCRSVLRDIVIDDCEEFIGAYFLVGRASRAPVAQYV